MSKPGWHFIGSTKTYSIWGQVGGDPQKPLTIYAACTDMRPPRFGQGGHTSLKGLMKSLDDGGFVVGPKKIEGT